MTVYSTPSEKNAWEYVEYLLNGNMKKFKATLGVTDEYKDTNAIARVTISADGKDIYSEEITPGNFPKALNLDINNAL
ncbi:NPCBM/NEW2 domain-containing protein [Paenibacillus sp. RC21]|uniref:NPCBM/NEW2 domain-containing protein n=1 Tax=Paenibacillus sp. RC21 TaxID=3156312 RepID=UPI0038367B99